MIGRPRREFNGSFTPEAYARLLASLDEACGCPVKFRICETPCFFPKELLDKVSAAGSELAGQLLSNPQYMAVSQHAIPEPFNVPNEDSHPLFVAADFGLWRNPDSGVLEPRLVEIQGFPSLYAFQPLLARNYQQAFGLDSSLRYLLSGLEEESHRSLLERAILNGRDPDNVVLLEIDPENQKTLPDFMATRNLLGIRYVSITSVRKQGRRLFYPADGKMIPIERIYNRVIVDELVRKNLKPPFDYRDDLDVEWAGHPNWFFRLSKFSIPYFLHYSVPESAFLSDFAELPDDLENWVLKPLFSFAGIGVVIGPSREQLQAIPAAKRPEYILQRKVNFERVIETPHGATNAEIRILYIWLEKLIPVTTIIRMGRGKMMGVDHNRDMEWVGASAAFYTAE
jgi:hypothetical protein